MEEITFIERFGKLEVKEGDIIVLKYAGKLSKKAHDAILKTIKETFEQWGEAKTFHVMMLEEGMDIGILRKE